MKVATLAIVRKDDKVLLGEKKKGEIGTGTLNGPGGKLEPGETLLECIVREAREELAFDLDPAHLEKVAIVTFFAAGEPDFKVHVYLTDTWGGTPTETSEMIPGWYDAAALPLERMLGSDPMWFPKVVSGEQFNAHVYYTERASGFERIEFLPFEDEEG